MKIIMGAVGIDEYHGCPYKHTNGQALKQLLETTNISAQSMDLQVLVVNCSYIFILYCHVKVFKKF